MGPLFLRVVFRTRAFAHALENNTGVGFRNNLKLEFLNYIMLQLVYVAPLV